MSQEDLLFAYVFTAPAVSIAAGIAIFFAEAASIMPAKMIAVAAKASAFVFAMLACRQCHESLEPVSRSFVWIETPSGSLELFFNADSSCLDIVLFLSIISLCAFAFYMSEAKFADRISSGRILALSCINEGCIYAALLSGTLLQSGLLFMASSVAAYLLLLSRCASSGDAERINLMVLSGIAADYMIIAGAAMLSEPSGISLNYPMIAISGTASPAFGLIMAGCAIKSGMFPFCFIFFAQKENDFKYAAKSLVLGNIVSSVYIICLLCPLAPSIPSLYRFLFEFSAALACIFFGIAVFKRRNIFMQGCLIAFFIASSASCSIFDSQQPEPILFSAISSASAVILFPHALSIRTYDESIDDINYKESPIFSSVYIFLMLSASCLPPFSGFARNASLCQIPLGLNGVLFSCSFFIMAFACMRRIRSVLAIWRLNIYSKRNMIESGYAAAVCLTAASVVIEINYAGFSFGIIELLASAGCMIPVFAGMAFAFIPDGFFRNISGFWGGHSR